MVEGIREVEKAMTIIDKDAITEGLGDMKHIFEKSVVAAYDLPSGIIISPEHLAFKKPGDGIKAKEYKRVIGRILNGPVAKDHKFIWENFLK
jgi:N-acetylneuraminate synthase